VGKNAVQGEGRLTRKKKFLFVCVSSLVFTLALAVVSEVVLRLSGIGPWTKKDAGIRVEPGGTFFTPHPTLGYTHLPGSFQVTLPDGYSFHVTHLPNTLRVTHPLDTYPSTGDKEEIWIFGCSFTHGWALNDEDTYAWQLQQMLPEYEVVNFGSNGYGTLQSLIQFREALPTRKPKVAVLAYASFHDARNTFLRKRQKAVAPWNKLGPLMQPYASVDRDGRLHYAMADVVYREFPLMRRSALAHFIEITYNNYEAWRTDSRAVTEALIDEMAALAKANGVEFVVAFISGKPYMMDYTRSRGIPTVDISVDESLPENTNRPHDNHPSALANRKFAETLEAFLREQDAIQQAKP
jgi:hypothetical protein